MILNIRVNNCYAFQTKVELNLTADMRQKKFQYNVYSENNYNILKSVGLYGPNNSGKTCLLKCIRDIKNTILNNENRIKSNIFNSSSISELGITFLNKGKKYSYDFRYDTKKSEYIYEKFSEHKKDSHGNEKEKNIYIRDSENKIYRFDSNTAIEDFLKLTSKSNILIHLIDETEFKEIKKIKTNLLTIANSIEYVDMNNIPIEKTLNLLKSHDKLQNKIVNFIKNSDLYMDDFLYADSNKLNTRLKLKGTPENEEKVLNVPDKIIEQIKLTSVYKGVPVPSVLFDSTGTKKIVALSSYIIEALENGKILVIDELDSSIHFKLARAIVSMFNNELNTNSQLIFSVHDINLMDCKKLFRKDQIWFIHKDETSIYLYSLSDFTATEGIRSDTTDIIEKYKKGLFGSLPDPTLINSLLEIEHGE